MRKLLLFAIAAGVALAQLSVSPTTCTISQIESGPVAAACALTITGSGAWTATAGVTGTWNGTVYPASGSGAATVLLRAGFSLASPGTYTSTATVAGQTIDVTVNVLRRLRPVASNYAGVLDSALGCTQTGGAELNWFYDSCTVSGARPGGSFDFPSAGSSTQKDQIFRAPFRPLAGYLPEYTNRNTFNADETLFITDPGPSDASTRGIFSVATGQRLYPHPRWAVASSYFGCQFSSITANVLYCLSGSDAAVRRVTLGTAPAMTGDGAIYTAAGTITDGGSTPPSKDDYTCAYRTDETALYAINLTAGTAISIDLTTITPALQRPNGLDYCLVSVGADPDGKRYIFVGVVAAVQTYDAGRVFSFTPGDAAITYERMGPAWPEQPVSASEGVTWSQTCNAATASSGGCIQGGHGTTFEAGGYQYLILPTGREGFSGAYQGYLSSMKFSSGDLMSQASEAGGGGAWISAGVTTHQMGARRAPYVVTSQFPDTGPSMLVLTDCTGSSPVTCTTETAHGWTTGQSVLIGGVQGMTGLRGVYTLASGSGSTFTISTATSGTYTANTGQVTANTTCSTCAAFHEVDVVRLSSQGRAIQTFRASKHRSVPYVKAVGGSAFDHYGAYPFPTISKSGRYVAWNTNAGYPNETGVYVTDLGALPLADEDFAPGRSVAVTPSATSALFSITPIGESITCSVSVNRDLTSATTATALGGSAIVSSLSVSTLYYWRCASVSGRYVAVGQFTTLSGASGSIEVTLAIGSAPSASVAFEYGPTVAYGSTSTSTCTIGQRCTATITATRGTVLYWRAAGAGGFLLP